ncbi:MAG: hypothetical protein QM774_10090 [Gordonia sp. (in: high G+C Gram-positive bacteria)]|uniref:hypothetical protein n=1 Tax=Gordonia sp. (in: high G+C Gram-positive bacteria) TaxID=84139 RepID=UPI0039E2269C
MDNWGILAGGGLLAAVVAAVAYATLRQRETVALNRGTELARNLRDLAGDDPVRLAAVDEYEVSLYERLFYASTVGPRLRSAVWALLAAVLAAVPALLLDGRSGALALILWIVALLLLIGFAVAAAVYLALAVVAAATTPRVSFAESYGTSDDEQA